MFKEGPHHLLEIIFPFLSVGFGLSLVFVPGKQMSELMNSCDQEGVRVQVKINRDTMPGIFKRVAVVAMLGTPVS